MKREQDLKDELVVTPLKVAIHRKQDNPVFADGVIYVTLNDEAAGPFIVLQSNAVTNEGISLDIEELNKAHEAAHILMSKFIANTTDLYAEKRGEQ